MPKGVYKHKKGTGGIKGKSGVYLRTEEIKQKLRKSHKQNKKNHNWKGCNAGYRAKHSRIVKLLGKAIKCSFCGKEGSGHNIHWANKNHKYNYIKEDYFQACAKCHGEYDKFNKLRKRKEVMKY
ncbi:MAG TPA: hypothetical protein DHV62_09610 [Elusimicrobia bacterium]|nr:hypothetical protein [Elusimicrobiota bacterium]